ncbi:sensor histidine kinase [Sinomonas susongensis]|uniref:sensor histidine kinase n=1 Tax=Sinomonas susongensis TaxID=1324851 RepID=UPI0011080274|nr:ATP-binding protein [Sinomonas susongensis]
MEQLLDILLGQVRFHELGPRARVVLNQLPLNLTMLLVCVIAEVVRSDEFTEAGFLASQAGALLILAACAAVPWKRLPPWSHLVIPVLDFYVIGLLRFTSGDILSGLGLLAAFPIIWLTGSGYRPRLMVAFGGVASLLMVWVPHFANRTAAPSTLAAEFLTPFMMLAIGMVTAVMAQSAKAQQRRVQELLDGSETRGHLLDTILETVDVGVVVFDREGEVLLMNAQQRELHATALPPDADRAHEPDLLVYRDGSQQPVPTHERPARRAIAGETFSHEVYRLGKGPKARIVSVSAREFLEANGSRGGAVLAFSDVTEVVAAVRARETFVAAMSHEFRTPLTSLIGYAELLQDDPSLSPAARSDTQVMARNARHLSRMVDDILTAATSGATEDFRVPLDLARLVREQAVASAPQAAGRCITLEVDADGQVPILADRTGVVRIIDNLVSNALKYSDDGGKVRLEARREGTWAVLSVEDDGIGIGAEDLERVFKRFQRSSTAVRSGIPGTGLGLALAQEVAEQHGGELSVASELGVGSVFTLRLPLRQD